MEVTFIRSGDKMDTEYYPLERNMLFFKKKTLSKEEQNYMKFLAYDALVELSENSLPVIDEYTSACKHGIKIYSMQYAAAVSGEAEDFFIFEECSECFALYVGRSEHYLILYNDELPPDKRRWYISNALALIKLGMLEDSPNEFFSIQRDPLHSDEFSYYFTCPDVILDECNIKSPSDIIKYCKIPFSYANKKSMHLTNETSSKTFHTLEKVIKKNFSSFIRIFQKK